MEVKSKIFGTNTYKSMTIHNWKRYGVVCEDFDMLYQEYIKKTKCEHCCKDFKSTTDRCLDHDHSTGLFRAVVCRSCNSNDNYIKYPNGYDKKVYQKQYWKENTEHYKQWRENNKEKISELKKQHYQDNKEYINERNKQYRQQNKEKISEHKKQKVICECGSMVRINEFLRHTRSFKHMNPFCDYPKTNIFT
jgi:adenylate kinase family enzyme